MEARVLLSIDRVSKYFGGLPALREVSFPVTAGQVTALIGPNGAGKTTLLNCLSGILAPDEGAIYFNGVDLTALKPHEIARLGVARTFQNLRIFPRMSVLDNVLCGLAPQTQDSLWRALLRPPVVRHQERRLKLKALEALDIFGLTSRAHLPAAVLPYGDKKRLELARAFVSQPLVALLDEPVAGLNRDETEEIAVFLRQLRQQGKTMILVEHDMELVMGVADQVVVLDGGRLIAMGTPEEIRVNPLVLEAYLGRMSPTA